MSDLLTLLRQNLSRTPPEEFRQSLESAALPEFCPGTVERAILLDEED